MEEKELDRYKEKILNFLDKNNIEEVEKLLILTSLTNEILLDIYENPEEADNEDDFEDDFEDEETEEPKEDDDIEEDKAPQEKPKQEETAKEPKKSHDFYKKPKPKAPPRVNG